MHRITDVCPTIASMFGLSTFNDASPADEVLSLRRHSERVLMYNPDAVAWWIFEKYKELLAPVTELEPLTLKMESVMPSVTPVCFASMYTGLMPESHGIRKYEKPVLKCRTIFDALIDAGLKPVIIAEADCSISKIFLERDMEYHILGTVDEVNRKADEIIRENRHDLVVVYNGNYDATMHRYGPESPEALDALRANGLAFRSLYETAESAWSGMEFTAAFATDHGCHEIDGGCGSHGLDMDEDMFVVHMWK